MLGMISMYLVALCMALVLLALTFQKQYRNLQTVGVSVIVGLMIVFGAAIIINGHSSWLLFLPVAVVVEILVFYHYAKK